CCLLRVPIANRFEYRVEAPLAESDQVRLRHVGRPAREEIVLSVPHPPLLSRRGADDLAESRIILRVRLRLDVLTPLPLDDGTPSPRQRAAHHVVADTTKRRARIDARLKVSNGVEHHLEV